MTEYRSWLAGFSANDVWRRIGLRGYCLVFTSLVCGGAVGLLPVLALVGLVGDLWVGLVASFKWGAILLAIPAITGMYLVFRLLAYPFWRIPWPLAPFLAALLCRLSLPIWTLGWHMIWDLGRRG